MGAFGPSGFMYIVGLRGIGRGMEYRHDGGFFLLMGLIIGLESAFERATGLPVFRSDTDHGVDDIVGHASTWRTGRMLTRNKVKHSICRAGVGSLRSSFSRITCDQEVVHRCITSLFGK
jgi:hypothetical protein